MTNLTIWNLNLENVSSLLLKSQEMPIFDPNLIQEKNELSHKLSHAVSEIAVLKQENRSLKDKIINLESYSRRDNLLFYGIHERREEKNKDCATKVYDVLKSMKSEFSEIPIIKCHRKGKYVRGQVRPILEIILET